MSPLPILDTLPTEGVTSFTGHWYIEDSMARVKKINKIMFTYACRNESLKPHFQAKKKKRSDEFHMNTDLTLFVTKKQKGR